MRLKMWHASKPPLAKEREDTSQPYCPHESKRKCSKQTRTMMINNAMSEYQALISRQAHLSFLPRYSACSHLKPFEFRNIVQNKIQPLHAKLGVCQYLGSARNTKSRWPRARCSTEAPNWHQLLHFFQKLLHLQNLRRRRAAQVLDEAGAGHNLEHRFNMVQFLSRLQKQKALRCSSVKFNNSLCQTCDVFRASSGTCNSLSINIASSFSLWH